MFDLKERTVPEELLFEWPEEVWVLANSSLVVVGQHQSQGTIRCIFPTDVDAIYYRDITYRGSYVRPIGKPISYFMPEKLSLSEAISRKHINPQTVLVGIGWIPAPNKTPTHILYIRSESEARLG